RRHQGQHATGAKQDGVVAARAGQDRVSHDLSARQAGAAALFAARDRAGVQEDLKTVASGCWLVPEKTKPKPVGSRQEKSKPRSFDSGFPCWRVRTGTLPRSG